MNLLSFVLLEFCSIVVAVVSIRQFDSEPETGLTKELLLSVSFSFQYKHTHRLEVILIINENFLDHFVFD